MNKYYITSTMTADVNYHGYVSMAGAAYIAKSVIIKGGSNAANALFQTSTGVETEVTDEELELLKSDPTFSLHQKNGFIIIDTKSRNPEVTITLGDGMEFKDASAPLTPEDLPKEDKVSTFSGKKGTSNPLE